MWSWTWSLRCGEQTRQAMGASASSVAHPVTVRLRHLASNVDSLPSLRTSDASDVVSIERFLCLPGGSNGQTYTIGAQYAVQEASMTFQLYTWVLTVERAHGCA